MTLFFVIAGAFIFLDEILPLAKAEKETLFSREMQKEVWWWQAKCYLFGMGLGGVVLITVRSRYPKLSCF